MKLDVRVLHNDRSQFFHVCITMSREFYLTCGLLLEMTGLYVNLGSLVRGIQVRLVNLIGHKD